MLLKIPHGLSPNVTGQVIGWLARLGPTGDDDNEMMLVLRLFGEKFPDESCIGLQQAYSALGLIFSSSTKRIIAFTSREKMKKTKKSKLFARQVLLCACPRWLMQY